MKTPTTPTDIEVLAVKAGKKMRDVCKEAGISHSTFSRWKRGHANANRVTVQKLLAVFDQSEAA